MIKKWEYLKVEKEYEMGKTELDRAGKNGWELVTIIVSRSYRGHEAIHVFKREINREDD